MTFAQIVCLFFAILNTAAMGMSLGESAKPDAKKVFIQIAFITFALCGAFL